jgi:hypothetical protein
LKRASEVKTNLDALVASALQIETSDEARISELVREVHVLQCGALIAQAIDAQQLNQYAESGSATEAEPNFENLYKEAKELAELYLPRKHPMVVLIRSFDNDRAVCAASDEVVKTPPARSKSSLSLEDKQRPKLLGALPVKQPSDQMTETMRSGGSTAHSLKPTEKGASLKSSAAPPVDSAKASQPEATDDKPKRPVYNLGETQDLQSSKGRDIFADYVAEAKIEKEMHKPWFNNRQDELRNHVMEKSRFVRLQDHGKDIKALADPKYTSYGHSLAVKVLSKSNTSRSDLSIVKQTRQAGASSPESFLASQLRFQLDPNAKVMTANKRKKARPADE